MKRIFIFLWIVNAILGTAIAATLTHDQKEVQVFIQQLYAIDSLTFEYGYFNKKYDPERAKREIYPKYFSKELLSAAKGVTSVYGGGYIRHPSLGSEDLSHMSGVDPTKNPKISPPVVNGGSAYVDVYPDQGRTIYFLIKTPDGWRIINTASYNLWPRDDGSCWEPFYLVKPTPDQQALETKECVKYRQSQMPKRTLEKK